MLLSLLPLTLRLPLLLRLVITDSDLYPQFGVSYCTCKKK